MKRITSLATGLLFLAFVFIVGVYAQDTAPKMIRGGVLNGKAIKLPKPAYPAEAMLDNASGTVSVTVTIDEEGNVIEAKAVTGNKTGEEGPLGMGTTQAHPALCEAAEKAAMEAKFAPTKLSGQPIKVTGTIVYNFNLGGTQPSFGVVDRGRSVLNSRATNLPEPVYPAAALAVKAAGMVPVQVTVDEAGIVISAEALSGHPLLRSAAVDAARLATFPPTLSDGQPVRFSGVLTYEFSPDGIKSVNKTGAEEPINGGVLNGKATSLPKPAYPEAARAVKAGGAVSVHVVIDEQGNVVTAQAVSGNPLLRAAAVAAALEAKFSPTLLEGKPIAVSGVLVYNFVP